MEHQHSRPLLMSWPVRSTLDEDVQCLLVSAPPLKEPGWAQGERIRYLRLNQTDGIRSPALGSFPSAAKRSLNRTRRVYLRQKRDTTGIDVRYEYRHSYVMIAMRLEGDSYTVHRRRPFPPLLPSVTGVHLFLRRPSRFMFPWASFLSRHTPPGRPAPEASNCSFACLQHPPLRTLHSTW